MKQLVLFVLVLTALLVICPAFAELSVTDGDRQTTDEARPEEGTPVFAAGAETGGAGSSEELGSSCRLANLCVSDSICRQIYTGFYSCVWQEGAECDSIWCEYADHT